MDIHYSAHANSWSTRIKYVDLAQGSNLGERSPKVTYIYNRPLGSAAVHAIARFTGTWPVHNPFRIMAGLQQERFVSIGLSVLGRRVTITTFSEGFTLPSPLVTNEEGIQPTITAVPLSSQQLPSPVASAGRKQRFPQQLQRR